MKKLLLTLTTIILITKTLTLHSQCIDRDKITYGGDWNPGYLTMCSSYNFAFGGDTSKDWNVLSDPIDIMQIEKEIMPVKDIVERQIKNRSGLIFFSKIKFNSVEVAYPKDRQKFIDQGRQENFSKSCKVKYYFYYDFLPDSLMRYHIGIAVDTSGKIVSPFNFPSKEEYKPIDSTFTYCKLLSIARKSIKNIDPIKEIKFEFDYKTKRFYWLISQEIVNMKEGPNYYNQIMIDAADLRITKIAKATAYVDF